MTAPQPSRDLSWIAWDLGISTSLNRPGALSPNFADNIAPDVVTVRSGPLTISSNSYPADGTSPQAFGAVFQFDTPFNYNGSGDLLFTLNVYGHAGPYLIVDATSPGDVSAYEGIRGFAYDATTAESLSNSVPAFELTYEPVPEPAPTILAATGIGMFLLVGFWHRAERRNRLRRTSGYCGWATR